MKIFRSIALAFCMPFAMLGGLVLALGSIVTYPVLRTLADACDRAACGIKKLDLELALKFADKVSLSPDVLANMRRESNGFRQGSVEEYEGFAPMRTA